MRPKFLIALLGSVLFILIVVWLFRANNATPMSNETQGTMAKSTPIQTQQPSPIAHPASTTSEEKPEVEKEWESIPANQSLQARLEELARRRGVSMEVLTQQMLVELSNAWREAVSPPIDFYGKVVDENGMPMQGVSVTFNCLSAFPEEHFTTNVLTDADGIFTLKNLTGSILDVLVEKTGYEGTNNQTRFEYYSHVGSFHPDPNDPVIFHLQKKVLGMGK